MSPVHWILLPFLLLNACVDRREEATRTLADIGVDALRQDAARLYKQSFGGSGNAFAVIPESAWPPSFQRLRPRRVGAYPDGFNLALITDADTERGIFVVPLHFERREPRGVSDAKFEAIEEGVYWYAFAR